MKLLKALFSAVLLVAALCYFTPRGFETAGTAGAVAAGVMTVAVAACLRRPSNLVADATLTVDEILRDVIDAFKLALPGRERLGMDWKPKTLKLNKTYTAHIAGMPTIQSYVEGSGGYKNGATDGRGLLTDVDIKATNHKHVPLLFKHLDAIKDDKNEYAKVIANAGYVLAKAVIDDGLAKVTTRNFSQESVFAVADSDLDALENIQGDMNLVGADLAGRVAFISTPVATVLGADSRVASSLYYNQRAGGNALRTFRNIAGFEEVVEYPGLPSNNGTALTGITGVAATDVITKAAHGLKTGDPIIFPTLSGGTGLTAATVKYFAIRATDDTFKAASSYANAKAGTAVNFTADITDGSVQRYEALTGIALDMRGLAFIGGIPENFQSQLAASLGIPQVMAMSAVTHEGITMAAVAWQEQGTGNLYWSPVLVWGWRAGKEDVEAGDGAANADGTLCDYAGHRLVSL